MSHYNFCILKNESLDQHLNWVKACNNIKASFKIVDLLSYNWYDDILSTHFDYFLVQPSGTISFYKQLYDERLYIINKILKLPIYPSYEEVVFHENKRYLSYWLKAKKLPHPATMVFTNKKEALSTLDQITLPIVVKSSIGASGSGVKILRKRQKIKNYIRKAFSSKGIRRQSGPNFRMGSFWTRVKNKITKWNEVKRKLIQYYNTYKDVQKGFVILQEYIPHEFEWRGVKIGDSYFAHKKVKQGDKASGTKGIDYVKPPEDLLNFIRSISQENKFNCMAIDIFEDGKGGYLINELQTIFGHVQAYICAVDGKPGRYTLKDDKWFFEEGNFNTNLSYDLRLENVIQIIESKYEGTLC